MVAVDRRTGAAVTAYDKRLAGGANFVRTLAASARRSVFRLEGDGSGETRYRTTQLELGGCPCGNAATRPWAMACVRAT